MSDEHDYYSDQCSGCKWAEWRGGCLNKATSDDGSDLDAAERGECDHFEAGEPQKRPPQPGDRLHVQMPLDDYTALRTSALAATARAEAAEQLAERYGVFVQECGFLADIEVYSPDDLPSISERLGAFRARAEALEREVARLRDVIGYEAAKLPAPAQIVGVLTCRRVAEQVREALLAALAPPAGEVSDG